MEPSIGDAPSHRATGLCLEGGARAATQLDKDHEMEYNVPAELSFYKEQL
jgi:hypothetical protein